MVDNAYRIRSPGEATGAYMTVAPDAANKCVRSKGNRSARRVVNVATGVGAGVHANFEVVDRRLIHDEFLGNAPQVDGRARRESGVVGNGQAVKKPLANDIA